MSLSTFHWVLPNQLAGSSKPGLMGDLDEDLEFLWNQGVRVILTLLEEPLLLPETALPFKQIHFPIVDMEAPKKMQATQVICDKVLQHIANQEPVMIHCEAGTGRTGTLLVCCLMHMQRTAEQALTEARKIEPMYVRNSIQENFLKRYAIFIS